MFWSKQDISKNKQVNSEEYEKLLKFYQEVSANIQVLLTRINQIEGRVNSLRGKVYRTDEYNEPIEPKKQKSISPTSPVFIEDALQNGTV